MLCGLGYAVWILERATSYLVGKSLENTPESWGEALQPRNIAATDSTVAITVHQTERVNQLMDMSEELQTACLSFAKEVIPEIVVMHERQSSDVIDNVPTVADRLMRASVPATTAGEESTLAGVGVKRPRVERGE